MKKWFIIVASVLLLSFLTVRLFSEHVGNVKTERRWYVEQLNYEFSAEVDSLSGTGKRNRRLFFHLTNGSPDPSHENRLNRKLKHNGNLRFLVFRTDGEIEIIVRSTTDCLPGDSIYINTNADQIITYRRGTKISENKILPSLRGRPF